MKDGSTRENTVAHPPGTGDRLLTDADIDAKYRRLTHSLIDADVVVPGWCRQAACPQ